MNQASNPGEASKLDAAITVATMLLQRKVILMTANLLTIADPLEVE